MFFDDEVPSRPVRCRIRNAEWIADCKAEERYIGSYFSAERWINTSCCQRTDFPRPLRIRAPLRLNCRDNCIRITQEQIRPNQKHDAACARSCGYVITKMNLRIKG